MNPHTARDANRRPFTCLRLSIPKFAADCNHYALAVYLCAEDGRDLSFALRLSPQTFLVLMVLAAGVVRRQAVYLQKMIDRSAPDAHTAKRRLIAALQAASGNDPRIAALIRPTTKGHYRLTVDRVSILGEDDDADPLTQFSDDLPPKDIQALRSIVEAKPRQAMNSGQTNADACLDLVIHPSKSEQVTHA